MLWNLLVKDMKAIIYDVKSLAVILIMPIVLMSILGASLSGNFGAETESGVMHLKIAVVEAFDQEVQMNKVASRIDLDQYDPSMLESMDPVQNFYDLLENEELREMVSYQVTSEEEAYGLLEEQAISAIVFLPENFIYNQYMMLRGSRNVNEIRYVVDPERDFFAQILYGIINAYGEINNHMYAQTRTRLAFMSQAGTIQMNELMEEEAAYEDQMMEELQVKRSTIVPGEEVNSFQYYSAAIMCMFLLYSAGIGGRALLQEKKDKTLPRLGVTGTSIYWMTLSNYLRVVLLVALQSLIMIGYSALVLKVDWGEPLSVLLTIVLSSFAVAALGTLIAIVTLLSDNFRVANAFEFALVYFMALIGGSYIPVEGLPEGLQRLGFFSLNGQALKLYLAAMGRQEVANFMPQIWNLLGFGLCFLLISWLLLKSRKGSLLC